MSWLFGRGKKKDPPPPPPAEPSEATEGEDPELAAMTVEQRAAFEEEQSKKSSEQTATKAVTIPAAEVLIAFERCGKPLLPPTSQVIIPDDLLRFLAKERVERTAWDTPTTIPAGEEINHNSHLGVALYIDRSKNKNVVMYEHNNNNNNTKIELLRAVWLELDPPAVDTRRKKGLTDDRIGLSYLQRKLAYGISFERCPNPNSNSNPNSDDFKNPDTVVVFFVALPSRPMICKLLPIPTTEAATDVFAPFVFCLINGAPCVAHHIWVQSTEPAHVWQLPTVNYVEIFGYRLDGDSGSGDGGWVMEVERIVP